MTAGITAATAATTSISLTGLTGIPDGAISGTGAPLQSQNGTAFTFDETTGIATSTGSWLRGRYVGGSGNPSGTVALAAGDNLIITGLFSTTGNADGNHEGQIGIGSTAAGFGAEIVDIGFNFNNDGKVGVTNGAGNAFGDIAPADYTIGDLIGYTFDITKTTTAQEWTLSLTLDNITQAKTGIISTSGVTYVEPTGTTNSYTDPAVYVGFQSLANGAGGSGNTFNLHVANAIPEPASILLTSLAGLAIFRRRR
ncbi:MAG: PEP-CTERM sorting domain-containing protein [Verrucomicrobiaceae bacterium]